MEPLPKFDVTLSVSRSEGQDNDYTLMKEIVCKVKTGWDCKEVEAQLLSGGYVNAIIKVWPSDGGDEDAVIVKVLTPNSQVREDKETMVTVMRIAEAGGVGAPVLAEFNNGLIYGFTVGELLNPDVCPHDSLLQGKPSMTRQQYLEELHWLECEVQAPDDKIADEVVFCHNDVWWGNQLYSKEKDRVHLIDFDLCNFNYAIRDFAQYFVMGRMELIPNTIIRFHMFRESEKAAFIKVYLEERDRLHGGQGTSSQADIDRLIELGKPMEMIMVLQQVSFAYSYETHEGALDFIWAGNESWCHYFTLKKEYMTRKATQPKET